MASTQRCPRLKPSSVTAGCLRPAKRSMAPLRDLQPSDPKPPDAAGSNLLLRHPRQACQSLQRVRRPADHPTTDPRTILRLSLRVRESARQTTRIHRPTHTCQTRAARKMINHCSGTPPTLPLPPVPKSIQRGRLVCRRRARHSGWRYEGRPMNWRMLVEVETNTILYLRALSLRGQWAGLRRRSDHQ